MSKHLLVREKKTDPEPIHIRRRETTAHHYKQQHRDTLGLRRASQTISTLTIRRQLTPLAGTVPRCYSTRAFSSRRIRSQVLLAWVSLVIVSTTRPVVFFSEAHQQRRSRTRGDAFSSIPLSINGLQSNSQTLDNIDERALFLFLPRTLSVLFLSHVHWGDSPLW